MRESAPISDKQTLRQQLRAQRRALPPAYRQEATAHAARLARAIPGWDAARCIAAYLATPEEFDCHELLQTAWHEGKQTCLPATRSGMQLHFYRYRAGDALETDRHGIRQPPTSAEPVAVSAVDIMFLPLVGWNRQGTRLGMGAGYYDRALADVRPKLLVGLGFDCQENDDLPRQPWDVAMDYVLTESQLLACTSM